MHGVYAWMLWMLYRWRIALIGRLARTAPLALTALCWKRWDTDPPRVTHSG